MSASSVGADVDRPSLLADSFLNMHPGEYLGNPRLRPITYPPVLSLNNRQSTLFIAIFFLIATANKGDSLKKKQLKWILLCTLIVLGITSLYFYASRDIPPPDVSDLVLERLIIPPEKNAFTYFNAATNSFYWPTNSLSVSDYLKGAPVDEALIRDLIDRNEETIRLINGGIQCDICLVPEVNGFDDVFPYLSKWMKTAKMLSVKIRHDRLAGNFVEATDTCITLLRFGNLIQKDPESLVHYLVGVGVLNIGLKQAQDLACDQTIPLEDLIRLSGTLTLFGSFDSGLIRSLKRENTIYAHHLDLIRPSTSYRDMVAQFNGNNLTSSSKGKKLPGYFFQLNRTKLIFANFCRDRIKNAPLHFANMKRLDIDAELGLNKSKIWLIIRPNPIGKILCALMAPAIDGIFETKCKAECNVYATRLLVALNAYQKMEGQLPDNLQALVPVYLPSVLNDSFDGKPFRFSPARRIIYSVGKDLKDSGGSSLIPPDKLAGFSSQDRWDTEDAVFQIDPGAFRNR
jgi:hypothetical protein